MAAIGILTGVLPFLIMQSLVPVLKNGVDLWMGSIWPVIGAGAVVSTIIAAGLSRRHHWYICFIFFYGCLVIGMFAAGFCLAVALLLGVLPETFPDLWFVNVVNTVLWVMISPLAWLLWRMLHIHYWQPWTTELQWEPSEDIGAPKTLLGVWIARSKRS